MGNGPPHDTLHLRCMLVVVVVVIVVVDVANTLSLPEV
jgi:hypothetical protein